MLLLFVVIRVAFVVMWVMCVSYIGLCSGVIVNIPITFFYNRDAQLDVIVMSNLKLPTNKMNHLRKRCPKISGYLGMVHNLTHFTPHLNVSSFFIL